MSVQLPKAGWFEKLLVLLGRRRIILVDGESMFPILTSGDKVIVAPASIVRIGDIVLAEHPIKGSVRIIKRVSEITPEGRYFLVGDSPLESSDSRSFGAVSANLILGRITSKL
jgi:nickel-type superoxide dismutase maturation protease